MEIYELKRLYETIENNNKDYISWMEETEGLYINHLVHNIWKSLIRFKKENFSYLVLVELTYYSMLMGIVMGNFNTFNKINLELNNQTSKKKFNKLKIYFHALERWKNEKNYIEYMKNLFELINLLDIEVNEIFKGIDNCKIILLFKENTDEF